MNELKPGRPVPQLKVDTVLGRKWSLQDTSPRAFDLIAIYRGSFCSYCQEFVAELAADRSKFSARGIDILAVSMDNETNANWAVSEWQIGSVTMGYGLSIDQARDWDVFLTTREQNGQSITFCEPALFLVTPDKRLYAAIIQSIPCGRPDLSNLIRGLDFLASQNYPIRGAA
jgi:peroxiredoxin